MKFTCESDGGDDGPLVGAVQGCAVDPPARGINLAGDVSYQFSVDIADDEAGSFVRELAHQSVADAAETGDDDDLVLKQSCHADDDSRRLSDSLGRIARIVTV